MNEEIINQIYADPRFETFFQMLIEWNQKFNLTAITQKEDVYIKHFLDSAVSLHYILPNAYVLDIGCGAGFPSIPLSLLRSDLRFLAIDSSAKKISFVNEVISNLNIKNFIALHTRIEDLKDFNFDVTVSRAVAPMNILCEYALPFLKIGGLAIFYKTDIEEELNTAKKAIKILGGSIKDVITFTLPKTDIFRSLVLIKKISDTPKIYPRPLNKPRKEPL